ncbi:hypothetical protein Dimus_029175 [Dionaea muscipula]
MFVEGEGASVSPEDRRPLWVRGSPSPRPPRAFRAPPSPGPGGRFCHRRSSPLWTSSDLDDFSSSEEGDSMEVTVMSSEEDDLRDPVSGHRPLSCVPELSPIKELEGSISGSMSSSPAIEALLPPTANDAGGVEARLASNQCLDLLSSDPPSLQIDDAGGFTGPEFWVAGNKVEVGGSEGELLHLPPTVVLDGQLLVSDGQVFGIFRSERQEVEDGGETGLGTPSRADGLVANSLALGGEQKLGCPRAPGVEPRSAASAQVDGVHQPLSQGTPAVIDSTILGVGLIGGANRITRGGGDWRLVSWKVGAQSPVSRVDQVPVPDRAVPSPVALTFRFEVLRSMGETEPEEGDRLLGSEQEQFQVIERAVDAILDDLATPSAQAPDTFVGLSRGHGGRRGRGRA